MKRSLLFIVHDPPRIRGQCDRNSDYDPPSDSVPTAKKQRCRRISRVTSPSSFRYRRKPSSVPSPSCAREGCTGTTSPTARCRRPSGSRTSSRRTWAHVSVSPARRAATRSRRRCAPSASRPVNRCSPTASRCRRCLAPSRPPAAPGGARGDHRGSRHRHRRSRAQLAELDRLVDAWNVRYRAIEEILESVPGVRLPGRPDQEKYVGSSIQFMVPGLEEAGIRKLVEACLARGGGGGGGSSSGSGTPSRWRTPAATTPGAIWRSSPCR